MSKNQVSTGLDSAVPEPAVGCWFVPVLVATMLVAGWGWSNNVEPIHLTDWVKYQEVFHDNLSRNLELEWKYQLDFGDSDWITAYSGKNSDGQYDWIYSVDAVGPTSAHLPAMPFLLAGTKRFLQGDPFVLVSAMALLLAVALALLINGLRDWFGWPVAIIVLATLSLEVGLHQSTRLLTGDGLLAGLVLMAFVCVIKGTTDFQAGHRTIWVWPIAGALLGATTLVAAQTNLWLIIFSLVWLICLIAQLVHRVNLGRFLEVSALFSIGVVVVAMPWWIRNCKVAEQFQPIGNSLQVNLIGGFSDDAEMEGGNLDPDLVLKHANDVLMNLQSSDLTLIEKESIVAESSLSKSTQWASQHSSQLPLLTLDKIGNHLGLLGAPSIKIVGNAILVVFAVIGIFASWRRMGIVVLTIVAASLIVTCLTWSDHGRLFVPLRPLLHASCAVGIVYVAGITRNVFRANQSAQKGAC